MNTKIISEKTNSIFPWLIMILMSSVTFVGILSELMPSGVLPLMMDDLNISEIQTGNLVGYYAIASAIFAIPLISMTMQFNRKYLLLMLLSGFAVSNIAAGLVHDYSIIIFLRVIGGICAGVMWPMIAAYGMRLVGEEHHGKAIAVIMAGTTLGISIGMPVMTSIGNDFGWRAEFIGLGVFIIAIAVISFFVFALLFFGIGSLISVLLAIKFTDKYLRLLTITMFGLLITSMLLILFVGKIAGVAHFSFFLWGLSFGPLVTLFQAGVSRQVESAKDVATSDQSSVFNLSIMIASSVAGLLLGIYSPMSLVYFAISLAIPGMVISFFAKKTLGVNRS